MTLKPYSSEGSGNFSIVPLHEKDSADPFIVQSMPMNPYVLHLISTVIAAAVGIFFNGYILIVLLWHRQFRTANNLLLLHLAFVDTVFCVVVLGTDSAFGALTSTSLEPSCQVHGFIWTTLPVVLVWTLCGLSCDRYAAISTPLHYSRLVNTKRAGAFLIMSWVLGAGLAVPPLTGVCPYGYRPARCACVSQCEGTSPAELGYAFTYLWLVIVFPVSIILICNLHVLTIARYHRHRIVAAIYEVTLRAQATVTHQRNPCYLSKFKGRNAVLTIAQLVGSLVVLTVPYFVVLVWEAATGKQSPNSLASVSTVLLSWTPTLNAYVYGVKSRVLRQTFKDLLRRHFYRQDVNREVDRRMSLCSVGPGRPRLIRRFSAPDGLGVDRRTGIRRVLPRRSSEKYILKSPAKGVTLPRRPSFLIDGLCQPSRVSVFPLIIENGLGEEEPFNNNNVDERTSFVLKPASTDPKEAATRETLESNNRNPVPRRYLRAPMRRDLRPCTV